MDTDLLLEMLLGYLVRREILNSDAFLYINFSKCVEEGVRTCSIVFVVRLACAAVSVLLRTEVFFFIMLTHSFLFFTMAWFSF
jgi:hypothetical protein